MNSIDLMPKPFEWVEILGKGYSIAKYPITNAQYAKFIEAGGYHEQKWWTDAGWEARKSGTGGYSLEWKGIAKPWILPGWWDEPNFNQDSQPFTGISWYEAISFCNWLTETTNEKTTLPTEVQSQYVAQGDDRRAYPWGDEWDCTRCNNSVKPCEYSTMTTPVTRYAEKGDSPFDVVDIAGNVWEWCLTIASTRENTLGGTATRVMKHGCWSYVNSDFFRGDYRHQGLPNDRIHTYGFRIVRNE